MNRRRQVGRALAVAGVLVLPMVAAYGATLAWRGELPASARRALGRPLKAPLPKAPVDATIASGRHLIAFVFIASQCGACRFPATEEAIRHLRASLQKSQRPVYADVRVVAVVVDGLSDGLDYLQQLSKSGQAFDEVSVGDSWMNQLVIERVWRDGVALPVTPQVLLVQRQVDASQFPRAIGFQPDSILLRLVGREQLTSWVDRGTPLSPVP